MFFDTSYYDLPVEQVAMNMSLDVVETRFDGEWGSVLIKDDNSGLQFWVTVNTDGSWEFNEWIFCLRDERDCWMRNFYQQEEVVLAVDDVIGRATWRPRMPIDANGTRHVIKITFENGDTVVSRINGTKEEILRYYIGTTFNLGREADLMVKAIAVDFLEE